MIRDGWKTYIIRAEQTRLYKIGRSMNPAQRLRELQVVNADTLTLVATCDANIEQHLHEMLASSRHHNEWFLETPKLVRFVTRLQVIENKANKV